VYFFFAKSVPVASSFLRTATLAGDVRFFSRSSTLSRVVTPTRSAGTRPSSTKVPLSATGQ
jgi:hypothetical protein